ncbi:MAG: hypothetical protein H7257_13660 [Taibaiella sp.]|nr:hypothetical protein [Taibaiella sp.]
MQLISWLIAVLLSAGAALWVYKTDKKRVVPYPWVTALLRGLVVFFTVLLVLVPAVVLQKHTVEKPVIVMLQDNSRSAGIALGKDTTQYRADAAQLMERLSAQYKVVQWGFGGAVQEEGIFNFTQPATDISSALTRVQEYYGMQNLGAVILPTDGRFNQGANPLYMQLAMHSPLYTVAMGDSALQKDLRIANVYANKSVTLNAGFEIRADVVAELCGGYAGSISLTEGNTTLATAPVAINNSRYDRSVSFTLKADKPGLHHYSITAPAAEGEKNTGNNRKDIFVEVVDEKKNILIASASPHPDVNAIKDALAGIESYRVTITTADNLPATFAGYDVVVLHGLPSMRNDIAAKLMAARKPVWFILTSQTNLASFNTLHDITGTNILPGQVHDALPLYNTSFNTFTLPQQILTVTDQLPPLTVAWGNIPPLPGGAALFNLKADGGGQSGLWLLQQGVIPSAILAGEGLWRWRLYEYKNFNTHNVIDECIRQTVAFLAANSREKPFTAAMPKYVWRDQEPVSIRAYLLNANNEQINTPDAGITITDSAGRKREFSLERSGNTYFVNIGIWAGGTYTYTAKTIYNGKQLSAGGSFAVETVPVELMDQGADYAMLYSLAKKYNGGFTTAPAINTLYDSITRNERIKPVIQTNTETVPFVDRKWYFFIILLLAVAEWLLRKYWLAQ